MKKKNVIKQLEIQNYAELLKMSTLKVLKDDYGEKLEKLEKQYLEYLLITGALETIKYFGNDLNGINLLRKEVVQHLQNQLILNQCIPQNN